MKAILHDYQRKAVDFIINHTHSALFLDMGLGKTLITLTAFTELARRGKLSGNVLVIAPKRIAVNTWPDEITKWEHTKNASFVQLAGISKKKRTEAFNDLLTSDKKKIYIINRELIPQLVDIFGEQWPFDNVVIDELQGFKSYNSKRFKALKKVAPKIKRLIGLTGTPAPNSLLELWPQIYLLDSGARLGKNITAYRTEHFHPGRLTPQGYPYEWFIKDGHEDIIYDRIRDVAISMTKEDYLTMPKITTNIITCDMSKSERKVYDELKKEKVLPLVDGSEIQSANAAVLTSNLLQLSNGAIYADDENKQVIKLHDHKLDALEEIIDGSQGQPILCFYWFKHDLKRLQARFPEAVTFNGKPEQMTAWNNGEIPVLFAQPASAGHGLNFQHGGHIIVFFSLTWSLELYEQSIARVYRQGQTKPVIVHHIIMRNTVEKRILESLKNKKLNHDELMHAVRAELIE